MKVADFFCGAGGFSEGFRIQGFKVAFGLDNWQPAIKTHEFNHPDAKHFSGDILSLTPEQIDEVVPDTEVITGSPPCISFSYSNKAGKADKSLGTALIMKYLQIVAIKKNKPGSKLKHWLMENVPNSAKYVKRSYTFKELGLSGGDKVALTIPIGEVLNAADYGAPQTRQRFVCGDFPLPKKSVPQSEWVTMRQVHESLGDPLRKPKEKVTDINWDFTISGKDLTDHHYDSRVEEFEWQAAKRLKVDHGFMGKMSFPESLDRPSRTVMATQSAVSRESIIFGTKKKDEYRLPTIREIACFMGFPITYQFEGGQEGVKYRLVGNAVCPKMSAALALAIKEAEGAKLTATPDPNPTRKKPSVDLTGMKRKRHAPGQRRPTAKFIRHVPYLKTNSLRVELNNTASDFKKPEFEWRVVLHRGSGKSAVNHSPSIGAVEQALSPYLMAELQRNLEAAFDDEIPDAKGFQEAFVKNGNGDKRKLSPEKSLEIIKSVVDDTYPEDEFDKTMVDVDPYAFRVGRTDLPIRILAGLYACLWIVERVRAQGRR
jgi:DNA (cytosine-5)-methyltransferase 1